MGIMNGITISSNSTLEKSILLAPGTEGGIPEGFTVERDARLNLKLVIMPGFSADIPLTIDIVGEGAEVSIDGLCLSHGTDKVTFDVRMNHKVGHCRSNQNFRTIASGESDCRFHGRIVVAQDAQQTEAYQENHNLLLDERAKVETLPQLEIYADDVKCSHGASIGNLNEDERFYMRSRGISGEEAKVLQMISFAAPVMEGMPEEERQTIENAIRGL